MTEPICLFCHMRYKNASICILQIINRQSQYLQPPNASYAELQVLMLDAQAAVNAVPSRNLGDYQQNVTWTAPGYSRVQMADQ